MEKIITINGKELKMHCNAATPLLCKRIFKMDLYSYFSDVEDMGAGERIEGAEKMAYTMCLQAEKPLSEALNGKESDFIEWLAGFGFDDITTIIRSATEMWGENNKTSSTEKNEQGPQ